MASHGYPATATYITPDDTPIANTAGVTSEDPINPSHYKATLPNGDTIELADILEAFGLHNDAYIAQAIQYLIRAGHKTGVDANEDYGKARWFIYRRMTLRDRGITA